MKSFRGVRALAAVLALGLAGCGVTGSQWADVEKARIKAEGDIAVARFQAMTEEAKAAKARADALQVIGQRSDVGAVAAAFALKSAEGGIASVGQAAGSPASPAISSSRPPEDLEQRGRAWAAILLPALVHGYAIGKNADVAITQSNNSAAIAIGSYGAIERTAAAGFNMGSSFVATLPSLQPNITTNNSIGGNGVIGSGSYTSTVDSYNVTRNCATSSPGFTFTTGAPPINIGGATC